MEMVIFVPDFDPSPFFEPRPPTYSLGRFVFLRTTVGQGEGIGSPPFVIRKGSLDHPPTPTTVSAAKGVVGGGAVRRVESMMA